MDKLPDWITAVSTALTAAAAIATGAFAYVSIRRDAQPPMPVVEVEFEWAPPARGRFVALGIVIRNQLYETITFESFRIKKPRGMTLAFEGQREFNEPATPPNRGVQRRIERYLERTENTSAPLDWKIAPVGEMSTDFPGSRIEFKQRRDVYRHTIYLSPPDGWDGGLVKIELRISSKALTIRPRRVTITRQIPVAPKTQSAETASSQG